MRKKYKTIIECDENENQLRKKEETEYIYDDEEQEKIGFKLD